MDKPITFNEWLGTQGNMVLLHANCCRIAYEAGQQSMQARLDELQHRNQMLNDNIKEQGQKLVYQNEVIETQAEKLLGLRDEKAELQKQIDALEKSYFVLARIKSIASKNLLESILIKEVRQALKGEGQ
ncbi:hypothetical protein ABTO03_02905 [Acinetobacter baumannii]|uniref:hypothetical protein n=1 Tax=Acinetobacter baumannii TaxID=470 RepID=UPI003799069B